MGRLSTAVHSLKTSSNGGNAGALEKHEWYAYQTLCTVLGFEKGTAEAAYVRRVIGIGKKGMAKGFDRWVELETSAFQDGLFFKTSKATYRNSKRSSDPVTMALVKDYWDSPAACSPCPNKNATITVHCEKGHTMKEVGLPGGGFVKKRVCPNNGERCQELPLCYQVSSDTSVYRSFCVAHPDASISKTLFVSEKPPNIRRPTMRTCLCSYHVDKQNLFHDWSKASAIDHKDCGTDQAKCNCESLCKDGACRIRHPSSSEDIFMEAVYCKERLQYQTAQGGAKELVPYGCLKGDCKNANCGWDHKEPQPGPGEDGGNGGEELREGMLPSFCQCSIENDPEANITYRVYREEIQEQSVSGAYRGDVEDERSSNEKREGAKNLVIRAITTSRPDFLKYLKVTMKKFVVHAFDAKWQADEFQRCKDTLGLNDICIVIDFAMNYGHAHQDAIQSEHWSKHQSTIVPVAIWYRDKYGNLVMEAIIFVSEDTKHSNKFVQYVLEKVIKAYQEKLWGDNERELKRVHVWSDGCAGQFKNRNQLYWLVRIINSLSFKAAVSGPYVTHNFFASCHGKGPSDALAAIIKTALSRAEKFGNYFPDTESLLPWLNATMAHSKEASDGEEEVEEGVEEAKTAVDKKKKGNIASLSFEHVKLNEVRKSTQANCLLKFYFCISTHHQLCFPPAFFFFLLDMFLRSTMPSTRQSVQWRVLSHFIPLSP